MTALCEMATVDQVRIHIKATSAFSVNPQDELMEIQLYSAKGGSLGKIRDLLFAQWNEGQLPMDAGQHDGVGFVENPVKFFYGGQWVECDVFAHLTVGKLRFAGELTDAQVKMLTGEGPEVEMPDIEEEWRKLAADELADADVTFEGVTPY
jgi:hypothetical protein